MKNPFYNNNFRVTSPYGNRVLANGAEWHNGIDLVCDNPVVYATDDGLVQSSTIITDKSNKTWQWGNYVKIRTVDNYEVFCCHLKTRAVSVGQRVNKGDVIGIAGNTGYSFGVHLHFEVRKDGKSVNAAEYLGIENHIGKVNFKEEEEKMTRAEILKIIGDEYIERFDQLPEYAKPTMRQLLNEGIINGGTSAEQDPDDINMFLSDIKTIIITQRLK